MNLDENNRLANTKRTVTNIPGNAARFFFGIDIEQVKTPSALVTALGLFSETDAFSQLANEIRQMKLAETRSASTSTGRPDASLGGIGIAKLNIICSQVSNAYLAANGSS